MYNSSAVWCMVEYLSMLYNLYYYSSNVLLVLNVTQLLSVGPFNYSVDLGQESNETAALDSSTLLSVSPIHGTDSVSATGE